METPAAEGKLRPIRRKEQAFLTRELEHWRWLNLLDEGQASAISSLYEPAKERFLQVFMGLGAMLVGLGLLSYIAANWMVFGRALKVVLIVGAYVLSVAAAYGFEPGYPYTSRAFLLLGGFAYGGGIFLIAQIFNEGGAITDALFWWMAGLVPACLLFKDRMQLLLIQGVSLVYFNLSYGNWWWMLFGHGGWDWGSLMNFLIPIVLGYPAAVLAALWVLWWAQGRQAVGRNAEGGRWGVGMHMNIFITLNFLTICLSQYYMDITAVMLALFALGFVMCALCAARPGRLGDSLEGWSIALIGVFGIVLSIPAVWELNSYIEAADYMGLAGFCADTLNVSPETAFSAAAAIAACAVLLWRVHSGSLRATVFFCFMILRYYFDFFYDFMDKALYFTTGGVLLMAMGFYLQRARKKRKRLEAERAREAAGAVRS